MTAPRIMKIPAGVATTHGAPAPDLWRLMVHLGEFTPADWVVRRGSWVYAAFLWGLLWE